MVSRSRCGEGSWTGMRAPPQLVRVCVTTLEASRVITPPSYDDVGQRLSDLPKQQPVRGRATV